MMLFGAVAIVISVWVPPLRILSPVGKATWRATATKEKCITNWRMPTRKILRLRQPIFLAKAFTHMLWECPFRMSDVTHMRSMPNDAERRTSSRRFSLMSVNHLP